MTKYCITLPNVPVSKEGVRHYVSAKIDPNKMSCLGKPAASTKYQSIKKYQSTNYQNTKSIKGHDSKHKVSNY